MLTGPWKALVRIGRPQGAEGEPTKGPQGGQEGTDLPRSCGGTPSWRGLRAAVARRLHSWKACGLGRGMGGQGWSVQEMGV